jgi:predicted nicotinamide N-methyase
MQEVKWTDDAIRWQGGLDGDTSSQRNKDEDESSTDEGGCMVDPFADPDPTELQTFRFVIPSNPSADAEEQSQLNHIEVSIQGYKTGADAVWKSTGLTLWRASHYLCQYQVEHPQLFAGNVLELGAGLGLNGILGWKIMCQYYNASYPKESNHNSVCITDGDSDALVHLRENIQRNRMNSSSSCDNDTPEITCHQLLWGLSTSQTFLNHVARNKKYNTIIASDVIYAPSIVEPLWETIQTLLDNDGVFVMAFARRKVPVSIELVLESAEGHGFRYELVKEDKEEGIWVYLFRFEA